MRIGYPVLFSLLFCTCVSPARAMLGVEDLVSDPAEPACGKSVSSGIYSEYAYPALGQVYWDKPVIQTEAALSCGAWNYSLWNSSQLSGSGPYGRRGSGDEFDFTASYARSFESGIGPLEFEASAAYWLFDGFAAMKDDYLAFDATIGRPFVVSESLTVTPYVRASAWPGLTGQTYLLAHPGASMEWTMAESWRLGVDASWTADLSNHVGTANASFTLDHDLGRGLGVFASALVAERMTPGFGIGLRKSF
jgi:hypothetical protein